MTDVLAPVLAMHGISKRFPGVHALDDVDFEVRPGEVHALLGENGAGKSTLIKIMAGVYAPDEGSYLVDGVPVEPGSPRAAHARGVSVVFQELSQVESLSVAENVFFGRLPKTRYGTVDRTTLHRETVRLLHVVGLSIDPASRLGFLSVAQRQLVEIAKALSMDAKVIAMDEPTSALSYAEIETLFSLIGRLTEQGVGIVYVSHKLDELFRICDRITVLRDGRKVGEEKTGEVTSEELVRLMVGRQPGQPVPAHRAQRGRGARAARGARADLGDGPRHHVLRAGRRGRRLLRADGLGPHGARPGAVRARPGDRRGAARRPPGAARTRRRRRPSAASATSPRTARSTA